MLPFHNNIILKKKLVYSYTTMKGFTTTTEIKLENGLSSSQCFITIDRSEISTQKEEGKETYRVQTVADVYSSLQAYTDSKPMMTREVCILTDITYTQLTQANPYQVVYDLYLKTKYPDGIVDVN